MAQGFTSHLEQIHDSSDLLHRQLELTGNLTIRGKTKALTFPVTLTRESAQTARLDGTVVIKRLDFNLGQGAWSATGTVANDVTLIIRLTLNGK